MFTGIVTEMGKVESLSRTAGGTVLRICCDLASAGLEPGESVAVSGVCLTVEQSDAGAFRAAVSPETMRRTTLGGLLTGDLVNLERALTPAQRLGGHFVQGHVDGVGRVRRVVTEGLSRVVTLEAPGHLLGLMVERGSVAVDGVSLTLSGLGDDTFQVTLIPTTLQTTLLGRWQAGSLVNLEGDILAKYVARALSVAGTGVPAFASWLAAGD